MGVPANLLHQFVPEGRNFAALSKTERARLRTILRPLPWLDGFITALAAVPEEPAGWTAYIRADDALESVTEDQASKVDTVVLDHSIAVAKTLFTDPESYQPFLADGPDRDQGAAQWAAGFRFGIELHPEPWRPLIEDDAARTLYSVSNAPRTCRRRIGPNFHSMTCLPHVWRRCGRAPRRYCPAWYAESWVSYSGATRLSRMSARHRKSAATIRVPAAAARNTRNAVWRLALISEASCPRHLCCNSERR
jgi:yecA family protein